MKIDYEITVDAQGMSIEDSKKAQDAYFELGIGWRSSGKRYLHLDIDLCKFFTNRITRGDLSKWLMTVNSDRKPTHTFHQLLELAGVDE